MAVVSTVSSEFREGYYDGVLHINITVPPPLPLAQLPPVPEPVKLDAMLKALEPFANAGKKVLEDSTHAVLKYTAKFIGPLGSVLSYEVEVRNELREGKSGYVATRIAAGQVAQETFVSAAKGTQ